MAIIECHRIQSAQGGFQIRFNFLRSIHWRITLEDFTIAGDEELGEIPFDRPAQKPAFMRGQVAIKRIGPFPIDFDLTELRESRIVLERAKIVDFRVRARGLMAELVTRKIKNLKTLLIIGFIKLLQALILGVKPQPVAVLTINRTLSR